MKLRVKPSRKSLERDRTFGFEYAGKKYSIGPEPVEVDEEAARYLLNNHSGEIEADEEEVLSK